MVLDEGAILRRLEELKKSYGIIIDVGCGNSKQDQSFGIDIRPLPGVDLVWDLEDVPYPLPSDIAGVIVASHIVEHISPQKGKFIAVMDEWWRLCRVGGKLIIGTPYGMSPGYVQDPSHCNPCSEVTFAYFDPDYDLYQIYQPKPWRLAENHWKSYGNLEVVLEKRAEVQE